jgi:nickel-dependent lactate racemase
MSLCLELEEAGLTTIQDTNNFNQQSIEQLHYITLNQSQKCPTQTKLSTRQLPEWLVQKRNAQISQLKKTRPVKNRKVSNIRLEPLFLKVAPTANSFFLFRNSTHILLNSPKRTSLLPQKRNKQHEISVQPQKSRKTRQELSIFD